MKYRKHNRMGTLLTWLVDRGRPCRPQVWFAIAMVVSAVFLLRVQWLIVTYACGNDPMLYMRAARVLLSPGLYGAEAVRHSLTFVAPGYPVILAATIGLFGSLSPYWLNVFFLIAGLPLMWLVLRRLLGSDRAAAFAILGSLLILFWGHKLNAPYLLYPFRESARMFFVYAAYAGVIRGIHEKGVSRGWIVGAGVAFLLACTIREPSVLILPGLLLGIAGLSDRWRVRLSAWGWVLLPLVMVLALAAIVMILMRMTTFSQFSAMQYLRNHAVAYGRMKEMMGWFPKEASWFGVTMIVVGVVRAAWRSRVFLAWFLLPALLFFVFYAYMQMHVRYFLTTMVFLSVFAGYGLDGLCVGLEAVAGRLHARGPARAVVTAGSLYFLAAGLLQTTHLVGVWGPRTRAVDVRKWQQLVKALEPSADGRVRIAVEQRCRYLEDILMAYTDAELLDPKRVDQWPPSWAPAHYFRPLNRGALYATPQWLMWLKVYAHRILTDRMDLVPVGPDGPGVHTLERADFAHYRLQPWTAGPHQQSFTLTPRRDHILWLDWGNISTGSVRSVEIRNEQSGGRWFSREMTGNGIQAVFLPGSVVDGTRGLLTMTASGPVPARPVFGCGEASRAQSFDLGWERPLSVNRLLSGLDEGELDAYQFSVRSGRWNTFQAPVLYSDTGGGWGLRFAGARQTEPPGTLALRRSDGRVTTWDTAMGGDSNFVELESAECIDVSIPDTQVAGPRQWHAVGISLQYRLGL